MINQLNTSPTSASPRLRQFLSVLLGLCVALGSLQAHAADRVKWKKTTLNAFDIACVVIGGIIGIGIFFAPTKVAKVVSSKEQMIAAWSLGGIMVLIGAFVYARLGMREEALEQADRSLEIMPVSLDAMDGSQRLLHFARTSVVLGDYDRAVELIGRLVEVPILLTPAMLRCDPFWSPLVGHAEYDALIAR